MIFQTFIVAFLISYVGSIPPGTVNISVMQLAMLQRKRAAIFLGLSASIVEFIYAGFTVQFHIFLNTHETLSMYFRIITAITLVVLGIWNLYTKSKSTSVKVTIDKGRQGFIRGILLGFLNPMTIPFWLAITTYLENEKLVLVQGAGFWVYLAGLSMGTFVLLLTVVSLGFRFTKVSDNRFIVHRLPGIILIAIGLYFFMKLLL